MGSSKISEQEESVCHCLASCQGHIGIVVTAASCKVVRTRERRGERVLVLRLPSTWHCVDIMSGCEGKEVGAAMVTSASHSSRLVHHCCPSTSAHCRQVGGEGEGEGVVLFISSVPHALVVPPLHHCCCCHHPWDTCLVEASLLSGEGIAVAVHPCPRVVGKWEGRERERASSSSCPHHGCLPAPSSSSIPYVIISVVIVVICGGITIAIHPCLRVVGKWEGRGRERAPSSLSCRHHCGHSPAPLLSTSIHVCML